MSGLGFPTGPNRSLQFRNAAGHTSIHFNMEVNWESTTRITLDMGRVAHLLFPNQPTVQLRVRITRYAGGSYVPISGWSPSFTLAAGAAQVTHATALQAWAGQYVCAEGGGGRELVANRELAAPWETFTLELIDGNGGMRSAFPSGSRVALKVCNGQYVCAEGGGGRELVANRDRRREWETFIIEEVDGNPEIHSGSRVALRACNGQYVCAEGGGGRGLVANRDHRREWETFVIELDQRIGPRPVLYQHRDYRGRSQGVSPGKHDHPLRIGNDVLSSVRVPPGYRLILCEHEHFEGRRVRLHQDTPFVGPFGFNDLTSSVLVGCLQVGANYTDLGCDLAGNFDYRARPDWADRLRQHVQRGLTRLADHRIGELRVWATPPHMSWGDADLAFMQKRVQVIAEEAAARGMNVTVDLHDFNREPVDSFLAGQDPILRRRIERIVKPNRDYPNLGWSLGNELRGPSDPARFAAWYQTLAGELAAAMGPGQQIAVEITPGAAEHRWGGDTTEAARRIIAASDIVSVHFYPACENPELERASMLQWQALAGDKLRIGELSVSKKSNRFRAALIYQELEKLEVMGFRGVGPVLLWQLLKAEKAGHIDDMSLELGTPDQEDPAILALASGLHDKGWLD